MIKEIDIDWDSIPNPGYFFACPKKVSKKRAVPLFAPHRCRPRAYASIIRPSYVSALRVLRFTNGNHIYRARARFPRPGLTPSRNMNGKDNEDTFILP